jgi:F-type H+-transporting ATPase subunit b
MISFSIFIWFCMKYVWPPVITVMEERQATIAAGLRDAERAQHDLKQAQQRGHDIVEEAKGQAADLVEQANRRATQIVEEARQTASEEASRIKLKAESEVQQQAVVAREKLRGEVASLALLGAQRILERQVSQADHDQMLTDLAKDL